MDNLITNQTIRTALLRGCELQDLAKKIGKSPANAPNRHGILLNIKAAEEFQDAYSVPVREGLVNSSRGEPHAFQFRYMQYLSSVVFDSAVTLVISGISFRRTQQLITAVDGLALLTASDPGLCAWNPSIIHMMNRSLDELAPLDSKATCWWS